MSCWKCGSLCRRAGSSAPPEKREDGAGFYPAASRLRDPPAPQQVQDLPAIGGIALASPWQRQKSGEQHGARADRIGADVDPKHRRLAQQAMNSQYGAQSEEV